MRVRCCRAMPRQPGPAHTGSVRAGPQAVKLPEHRHSLRATCSATRNGQASLNVQVYGTPGLSGKATVRPCAAASRDASRRSSTYTPLIWGRLTYSDRPDSGWTFAGPTICPYLYSLLRMLSPDRPVLLAPECPLDTLGSRAYGNQPALRRKQSTSTTSTTSTLSPLSVRILVASIHT